MTEEPLKPRMQFGIAGLMLAVLAVAVGCMGWKFAMWMDSLEFAVAHALALVFVVSTTVLTGVAIIIGRMNAALFSFAGLVANCIAILVFTHAPENLWEMLPLLTLSTPLAAAAGNVVNVFQNRTAGRALLAILSCFSAGWILAAIYLNAK